jgi:hypothetical protein
VRELRTLLWERFVVEFLRLFWIKTKLKLIAPAEFETRLAERIVMPLHALPAD